MSRPEPSGVLWSELDLPWVTAFEEAWAAWCAGNFGIGAVAVREGRVVGRGRNRVLEARTEAGVLAGTSIAHAEMNLLASIDFGRADVEVYSTLEPCLMCAASLQFAGVHTVRFAGADPLFVDVADAIGSLSFSRRRAPLVRVGPFDGPVGRFARLLPLTFIAFWMPDSDVLDANVDEHPRLVELARSGEAQARLESVRSDGGDVAEAYAALVDELS